MLGLFLLILIWVVQEDEEEEEHRYYVRHAQMNAVPNSDCAKKVYVSSDAGERTKGNFIQQPEDYEK